MNNELENNSNQLKKKLGNTPTFSVPENYMDGIEDDFFLKLKEQQFPASTSFETPDNYFDNLEDKLIKIVNTSPKKGKIVSLKSKLYKLIPTTIAASVLLFVGLQFLINKSNNITLDQISSNDIENWFEENTEPEFAFNFEDNLEDSELTFTSININQDAIEDYFNSIDNSDILNEMP